jgi:hypothetical protein
MRYFVGFIVTIALIIILIVMLAGGGGKKAPVPKTGKLLYEYAHTDAEVKLTVDGPVNYDKTHQRVEISVTRSAVTYSQINDYTGTISSAQSFPNSEPAFDDFLHALYHSGFTLGDMSKALQDEKGLCPQGDRYVYELKQDGKQLERFWATSCGKPKSFLGNSGTVNELFKAQVPNYDRSNSEYRFF